MNTRKLTSCALLVLALFAIGCNSPETKALTKKSSSGKTQEVLLAADKGLYTGATKELLDSILLEPQDGLPQPEPRFSVVTVPVSSLENTQMFQMHRNIILCDVKEGNPDKLYIHHDHWAEPQVFVDIVASSEESLQALLRKHANRIVEEIYKAEYRRMDAAFYKDRNVELMHQIEDTFGFSLTVGKEFRMAKQSEDFAWIMKRTKDFDLNVLVHIEPYREESQFEQEKIYNRLDTTMRRNVPTQAEGTYMGTERRFEMTSRVVDFEGAKYAVETRGLWRSFGDFMGGPFVNYTLLSPDGKQLVELTGFVYCPRFDKRDYMMQVDGICRSIKWTKETEN